MVAGFLTNSQLQCKYVFWDFISCWMRYLCEEQFVQHDWKDHFCPLHFAHSTMWLISRSTSLMINIFLPNIFLPIGTVMSIMLIADNFKNFLIINESGTSPGPLIVEYNSSHFYLLHHVIDVCSLALNIFLSNHLMIGVASTFEILSTTFNSMNSKASTLGQHLPFLGWANWFDNISPTHITVCLTKIINFLQDSKI